MLYEIFYILFLSDNIILKYITPDNMSKIDKPKLGRWSKLRRLLNLEQLTVT